MKSFIIIAPLLASLVASQTLLEFGTGDLPTCAESCTLLTEAADGCLPSGGAPVTNIATYLSCFCQSAYLDTLDTNDTTICDTTCTSQSDRDLIQTWYKNVCTAGTAQQSQVTAATNTATATTTTTAATATDAATTSGTATTTSSGTDSTSTSSSDDTTTDASTDDSWWHVHARWIAMAIVLVIGFILLLVFGICFKRRHRRRQQRASMAAPVVWGPHQNQHHTGGINYPSDGMMMEKGKGRMYAQSGPTTTTLPTSNQGPVDYSEKDGVSKGTSKLRKFMGRE